MELYTWMLGSTLVQVLSLIHIYHALEAFAGNFRHVIAFCLLSLRLGGGHNAADLLCGSVGGFVIGIHSHLGEDGGNRFVDAPLYQFLSLIHILPNLASAFINQLNVEETVTCGITSIEGGGESSNIIPDTARIRGSFRFFNVKEGEKDVYKRQSFR